MRTDKSGSFSTFDPRFYAASASSTNNQLFAEKIASNLQRLTVRDACQLEVYTP